METSGSTTSTKHVAVSTATADAGSVKAGTVSVIIPPGLSAALQDTAKAAVKACNIATGNAPIANAPGANGPIFSNSTTTNGTAFRLHKRQDSQVVSCLMRQAQMVANCPEVWGAVDDEIIGSSFAVELSPQANPALLEAVEAAGAAQAQENKILIAAAAFAAATTAAEVGLEIALLSKIDFGPDFGVPKDSVMEMCTEPGEKHADSVSVALSEVQHCP